MFYFVFQISKKTNVANKKRKATEKIENKSKKQNIEGNNNSDVDKASQNEQKTVWVKVNKHTLTQKDKTDIETKQLLNDEVIDTAQEIMKSQFIDPKIYGFQSVLNKQRESFQKVENGMIQILHRGPINSGHWFTISTLNCPEGIVNVFDSMYSDLDHESKSQILSIKNR